jgi:hypothetical protein
MELVKDAWPRLIENLRENGKMQLKGISGQKLCENRDGISKSLPIFCRGSEMNRTECWLLFSTPHVSGRSVPVANMQKLKIAPNATRVSLPFVSHTWYPRVWGGSARLPSVTSADLQRDIILAILQNVVYMVSDCDVLPFQKTSFEWVVGDCRIGTP